MVIFHSYVKLPEGILQLLIFVSQILFLWFSFHFCPPIFLGQLVPGRWFWVKIGPKEVGGLGRKNLGHQNVHLFAGIEFFHVWELWLAKSRILSRIHCSSRWTTCSYRFNPSPHPFICCAHPTTSISISRNWGIINNHVTPQSHVEKPQLEHMSYKPFKDSWHPTSKQWLSHDIPFKFHDIPV